ncbi:PSP1 domain-containing protein [Dysosmobacter sp.]|uniref:PSP1 domain-containing protein n=1 Tax=Dysosmobacter sp. TaxID=2591382 RepID=UPI002A8F28AE|nr:stage 0 sporulation family protein [Dysosmobacter sp.]MDY3281644.1 stage 0 sporulation family protein [Dysosmobacter sp.]
MISVRFRSGCKNYFFDPKGNQVRMGDQVIVETAQGLEFATCTEGNHDVDDKLVVKPLCAMVRMATDSDRRTVEYNRKRESEAFDICEKKIADHGLEMKLVNVSCSFDGSKIIFFFTADGRVDFRELVRDLASVFRARIELRQIGVRDEAKMIGGLGICGRPFCCSQFLDGFMPVSIKMAKTQNLSLNPTKISGTCGRLMCCLKYEQNAYEDAAKRMPKAESFVQTPDGPGNVKSVDLLREKVKVSLDSAAPSEPLKTYRRCEIQVLRNGKGSRDGIEIPERTERYVEPMTEEEIAPVISTPFYMNHLENVAAAGEDAPVREKIGGPESGEKYRRRKRGRGHRSGEAVTAEAPRQEKQKQPPKQENKGEGRSQNAGDKQARGDKSRRQPKKPRTEQPQQAERSRKPAPQQAAPAAPAAEGGESKRRRPHHRGGRRHRGGGTGGAEPKSE